MSGGGFMDWLSGLFGGGQQPQMAAAGPIPAAPTQTGFLPQQPGTSAPQPVPPDMLQGGNPLTGRSASLDAGLAGLSQLFQNIAAQTQRRPVGTPAPVGGSVSDAIQRQLQLTRQAATQDREDQQRQAWQAYVAAHPELGLQGLPDTVGQHALATRLGQRPETPDPRRNFITTRNGIFDVSSGRPVPVGGTGGGGGGDGSGAGGAGGAPFGAGENSRAYGVLINPRSDPNSPLYRAAWNIVAQGHVVMGPNPDPNAPPGSLVQQIVRPDMSGFRPPGTGAAPAGPPMPPIAATPGGYVAGAGGPPMPPGSPLDAAQAPPVATAPTAPAPTPAPASAASAPARPPGTPEVVTIGQPRNPQPTTDQSRTGAFATRMAAAEQVMQALEQGGYDPTNLRDAGAARGGLPGNYVMSTQGQQYRQAAENWVRANLRRESGAVIAADEMANEIRNYFPQPGDGPEVVAQKAANRRLVQQGLAREGGPAYREPPARATPAPGAPWPAGAVPATASDVSRMSDQQVQAITREQMRTMPLEALQAIVNRQRR